MTEIIQKDNNTWFIEDGFVRFFLLTGEKKAALIDSGVATPDAKAIAEKYTDLPIILLNTHGDGDHVSGSAAFSEIYMGEEDYTNCGVCARFPDTKLVPLQDGEVIDLGGRSLEIITIPGHTYGSLAILDVERRTLYAGDSVQDGHIFMFGSHRDPASFASSLEKLISISTRYDYVVASHGTPILPTEYVGKVLTGWEEVLCGSLSFTEENIHGSTVKSYQAKDCGFYC